MGYPYLSTVRAGFDTDAVQIISAFKVPTNGNLEKWRVYTERDCPDFHLQIWRSVGDNDYKLIYTQEVTLLQYSSATIQTFDKTGSDVTVLVPQIRNLFHIKIKFIWMRVLVQSYELMYSNHTTTCSGCLRIHTQDNTVLSKMI